MNSEAAVDEEMKEEPVSIIAAPILPEQLPAEAVAVAAQAEEAKAPADEAPKV